jgi:putative spermidine/putrescine transport system substrate-binding protein
MHQGLISRRQILLTGAASTALVMTGRPGAAQQRITATAFPGPYEEAARKLPGALFTKTTGAEIGIQPVLAQEAMAKVTASRANPPYDVVILDEATYLDSIKSDPFETIPAAKMKNLANVASGFGDARGTGVFVAAHIIGIAYNPKTVKTPPSSWLDLWKPEFKGRVGITNLGSGLGMGFLVEVAKLHGGSASNMDPAFAALKRLLPNVAATAPNPGALAALFQQGQIDISYNFLSAIEPLRARGVDVALARPKEGFILIRNSMHIVKNTRSLDLAAAYIDINLDPEVQAAMGRTPYVVFPTNKTVPFGPDLAPYAKDHAALAANTITDWATINPQRRELIDRFNREVRG